MSDVLLCCCLCLAVAGALVTVPALRLPAFVPAVTIVNPTEHDIRIDLSDATQDGWIDFGSVGPKSALTVQQLLDQGGDWVFRLRRAGDGRSYALLQLTRKELADAQWSITVPYRLLDLPRSPELDRIDAEKGP